MKKTLYEKYKELIFSCQLKGLSDWATFKRVEEFIIEESKKEELK